MKFIHTWISGPWMTLTCQINLMASSQETNVQRTSGPLGPFLLFILTLRKKLKMATHARNKSEKYFSRKSQMIYDFLEAK